MDKKPEKLVPEVRFKGFTDDWEQHKLDALAKFSKGKGYSKKDVTFQGYPLFLYGRLYTNYSEVVSDVDTYTSNLLEGSAVSNADEVVLPDSGETAEDIARASWINKKGILYMPTWHPAALLRDDNKKIEFWKDLKEVKNKAKEMNLAI